MRDEELGLRERKKQRTRLALTEAALRLFREQGYDQTTIAQIAADADVSTRTFFGYFPSKEDVLFGDTDERLQQLRHAITQAPPGAPVTNVIRTAIARIFDSPTGLLGPNGTARLELVLGRPELRAKALERVLAAHHELAQWLRRGHPYTPDDPLPDTRAGALLGGLISTALTALHRNVSPESLRGELNRALDLLDRIFSASPSQATASRSEPR